MANTILHKRSATTGNTPNTGGLALGELAVNTFDGKLFMKKNNGSESIIEVGAGQIGDLSVVSIPTSDILASTKDLFQLSASTQVGFDIADIPNFGFDTPSITYTTDSSSFTPPTSGVDMHSAYIRPDGLAVYNIDNDVAPGIVYEFLLSTAWDISSKAGSANASFTMAGAGQTEANYGVWFNPTGTKFITSSPNQWAEYAMATPYDIANAAFVQVAPAIGESTGASELSFSQDGAKAFRTRRAFSVNDWFIAEYNVGTPWDISTISLVTEAYEVTPETGSNCAPGCVVNNDGTKIFIVSSLGAGQSEIHEYTMITPYSTATMSIAEQKTITEGQYLRYPFWSPDGTDLYLMDNNKNLFQYSSTALTIGGLTSRLYHNGAQRLATSTLGVTVTGSLAFSGTQAQLALPNFATADLPSVPIDGGMVYDTDTNTVKVYNTASWAELGTITNPLGSDLDVNGYSIVGAPPATTSSAGGPITIQSATGGSITGVGGALSLLGGTGGTTSNGGNVDLTGGYSDGGTNGGFVTISGGNTANSAAGGYLHLYGGTCNSGSGSGGAIAINAGNADGAVAGGTGGALSLYAGSGTTVLGAAGGDVDIKAGSSAGNYNSGNIAITSGGADGATVTTGNINISTVAGLAQAGPIAITVGSSAGNYNGSDLNLSAGGAVTATYTGGDVVLTPGSGTYAGVVKLGGDLDTNGNNIITPDATTPLDIAITAGSTTSGTQQGGLVTITSGAGYAGAGNTGDGGDIAITGADGGGDVTGAIAGGHGAAVTITSGDGGTLSGFGPFAAGDGGNIDLYIGAAGTTDGGGGNGIDGAVRLIPKVGNDLGATLRFFEGNTNGTSYIELKAPNAQAGNITLTLPPTNGNAGDVLTTVSGDGIMTWVAPTAYQPLDTDLTNIAALTGTSGFLKTDGANTWTVDTETYTPKEIGITTETTTGRTLALVDSGELIECTNATGITTITIPDNSVVAFPIGTQILLEQGDATYAVTVAMGGTDTLTSAGTLVSTASQYSLLTLIKKSATVWLLAGDLA